MTKVKLTDAIQSKLTDTYTDQTGHEFKGQAISFLMKALREEGWKVGHPADFETRIQRIGFITIEARNRRGQLARVVTI